MSSGSQLGRTASASGCARLESAIPGGTDDWEGLNDHQLCELFKDPKQNGNRSVGQIVEHMSTPLVLWGRNPGDGRTPVPMPEAEFLAKVKEWAANGAACPAVGVAQTRLEQIPCAGASSACQ